MNKELTKKIVIETFESEFNKDIIGWLVQRLSQG